MSAKNKKRKTPASKNAQKGVGLFFSTVGKALFTVILVCVITGCIVCTTMLIYVMNFMEIDTDINLDSVTLSNTTIFYAEDEEEGAVEVFRMSGDSKRIEVTIDQIPQYVRDAFIATEDKRFPDHEGVDWLRTISVSIKAVLMGENQGGSTITQQLIKNVSHDDDVTPIRKLREIFRALELERNYSKDEILESYLNIIFLGGQVYGVEAAAQEYFGCHVWELTVPQAASLAGMTRSPNNRRPDLYPEKNKERRDYALKCMWEEGYITESEYLEYINTPVITSDSQSSPSDEDYTVETTNSSISSYYTDAVIEEVIDDFCQKYGWSRSYATQKLKNGGYRIYTNVDLKMQALVEAKYADPATFSSSAFTENSNGEIPESAIVIMDYAGNVRALVGGKGEKTESRIFNRATMSMRSPGSSMKPLSVYALALEYDLINWSTVLADSPAMQINGKDWPSNYENRYYGDTLIVDAVKYSRNTIPVKLMMQLTPEKSVNFLKNKLNLSTIVETGNNNDYTYSLAIGSLTDGIYLDELTAAYAIFGNGGIYYEPTTYSRIENSAGEVIIDNTPKKTRAISEDTASVMNRILWQVVNNGGTGKEARLSSGLTVVGKTGTTQDYNDLTFVGLNPYYVTGIWTGYDTPSPLPYNNMYQPDDLYKIVWDDIVEQMGLEVCDFTLSENIVQLKYCTVTGLLASSSCTSTGTGYYKTSSKPETCDGYHYTGEEDGDTE